VETVLKVTWGLFLLISLPKLFFWLIVSPDTFNRSGWSSRGDV
jgi:hypothetical protein